jgi:hypothetical protein
VDLVAFGVFALLGIVLFRMHLFGPWTFVGDGDRLDSFLNIRLYEVDCLRKGRFPTWNEFMFMGFNASGLHYMLPGADPASYLESLFPRTELFRVAGYISAALIAAAACAAYLFIRDSCGDSFPTTIGAVLYGASAFAVARIAQVDPAFFVLVLIPLALLALRRVGRSAALPFAVLAGLLSILLFSTFLQEAAYALILIGAYALYRSARLRSWRPILVLAAALAVAGLVAFPRVVTVADDVVGLDRPLTRHLTHPCELLRWLDDGVFGRFPKEAVALTRRVSLREGVQVYTSVLAAIVVVVGALRYRGAWESVAVVGFLLVMGWAAVPVVGMLPALGVVVLLLGIHVALAWRRKRAPAPPTLAGTGDDVAFHLGFVALTLGVILVEPLGRLFYLAFLSRDFTHSRFSLAAVLPICTLVAIFLKEESGTWTTLSSRSRLLVLWLALPATGVGVWGIGALSTGRAARFLGLSTEGLGRIFVCKGAPIPPGQVMKIVASAALFAVLLCLVVGARVRGSSGRSPAWGVVATAGWLTLGLMTAVQGVADASFQLNGPQNRTFPVPFENDNDFVAPREALRPPSEAALELVRQRMETDAYRTALVLDSGSFRAVTYPMEPAYGAHLAQFWRLRLIEGYGPGISGRMAALPWPQGTRSLRSLSFPSEARLPWPLLAALNVKYALKVNAALYYNLGPGPGSPREAGPDDFQIQESPVAPTPREFFVEAIQPVPPAEKDAGRDLVPIDPVKLSLVEGYPAAARFPTAGGIKAAYDGGRVELAVEPAGEARFLVLNEMYHRRWRAFAGATELPIYPANQVMRGLLIPSGVSHVVLEFKPFLLTPAAAVFYAGGLLAAIGAWRAFRWLETTP